MDPINVTADRLQEVDSLSNWMGDKPVRWTVKPADAPLTATEARVLAKVPAEGLCMGWVSRALAYAPIIRRTFVTKPEKTALYGLLARGRLIVERQYNPDTEVIRRP